MHPHRLIVPALMLLSAASYAAAQQRSAAPLRLSDTLVGTIATYPVKAGDSLAAIGARLGVDSATLARENGLSGRTLEVGQVLRVDNRHIVPGGVTGTIVINVPQRMLFLFDRGDTVVAYPVAVGRPASPTATGEFHIVATSLNRGPDFAPLVGETPAERTPLRGNSSCDNSSASARWIALSVGGIGIFSTDTPSLYGFHTRGCVGLHGDDVRDMFERVVLRQSGEIVYEPVLMAQLGERVFLEVHRDIYARRDDPLLTIRRIVEQCPIPALDWTAVDRVIRARDGIARDVTRAAEPRLSSR